jgi:hypothetical protein
MDDAEYKASVTPRRASVGTASCLHPQMKHDGLVHVDSVPNGLRVTLNGMAPSAST